MDFIPEEISKYAEDHSSRESAVLAELNRYTYSKILMPRMLSGHIQGRTLAMFSKMIQPKRILEVGTYTGYSAICLAEGLQPEGVLYTLDINEELEDLINTYIKKSGNENKIKFICGNAMEIIPSLNEQWDLVFIDADKENYSNYFDIVFPNLKSGGIIIADNVLWSGKVLSKNDIENDIETKALYNFSEKIKNDNRIEHVLLPIRDGLMMVRKK